MAGHQLKFSLVLVHPSTRPRERPPRYKPLHQVRGCDNSAGAHFDWMREAKSENTSSWFGYAPSSRFVGGTF
jgi:hypothetical protein